MEETIKISGIYKKINGRTPGQIILLSQSGSDRKYYRITDGDKTIIAAVNSNREENEAFVGFTRHFRSLSLPVPEVFHFFPEDHIYFLQDLGDTNLFTFLREKSPVSSFDTETIDIYRKALEMLVLFQTIRYCRFGSRIMLPA